MEGTLSPNFDIGLSFPFYDKKREDFCYFFMNIFLDFIKGILKSIIYH